MAAASALSVSPFLAFGKPCEGRDVVRFSPFMLSKFPETQAALEKHVGLCPGEPLMEKSELWIVLTALVREAGYGVLLGPHDREVIKKLTGKKSEKVMLDERQLNICAIIARFGSDLRQEALDVVARKFPPSSDVPNRRASKSGFSRTTQNQLWNFTLNTRDKINQHFTEHPLSFPFNLSTSSLPREQLTERCSPQVEAEFLALADEVHGMNLWHPTLDSNAKFPPTGWRFRSEEPVEQWQMLHFIVEAHS